MLVGYLALGGQKVFERVTSHPFYCGIVVMIDKIAHHPGLYHSRSVGVASSWIFHGFDGGFNFAITLRVPW